MPWAADNVDMRSIVVFWLVLATALLSAVVAADPPRRGRPKRARPPTFDQRTKDTFFEDADQALVGPRPQYGKGGGSPIATSKGNGKVEPATDASGGGYGWSKIISPETIEDEVKSIAKTLGQVITTPQQFAGGANKVANIHFSTLAVMFGIIAEYDGEVRWKKVAPGARTLFAKAGFGSRVSSPEAYNQARNTKQALDELISGGTIQVTAAETKAKWKDEVAYRPPLMQRLKMAHEDRLLPWTANPGEFRKHNEEVLREAEILAALADVISREGYEYADDDTYVDYCKRLKQGGLDLAAAVRQKNADAARKAAGEISKACAACHDGYRSG
jgi:hypothetical protein